MRKCQTDGAFAPKRRGLKVEPKLWQSLTDRAPADLVGSSDVEFAAAAKALAGYRMGLSFHPAEAGFEIVIQTN